MTLNSRILETPAGQVDRDERVGGVDVALGHRSQLSLPVASMRALGVPGDRRSCR